RAERLSAGWTPAERLPAQELRKAGRLVQQRMVSPHALLNGGSDAPGQAVGTQVAPLGAITDQGSDLVYARLGGFFKEPFEAVDVLGGGDGHMQPVRPFTRPPLHRTDLQQAMLRIGPENAGGIESPLSVHEQHFGSLFQAKHFYTMPA